MAVPKPRGQIWTCSRRARASSSASRLAPLALRLAGSAPYSGLSSTSRRPSVRRKTTLGVVGAPSSVRRVTAWRTAAGKSVPGPTRAGSRRASRCTQSLRSCRPAESATVGGHTSRTGDWPGFSELPKPMTVARERSEISPWTRSAAASTSRARSSSERLSDWSTTMAKSTGSAPSPGAATATAGTAPGAAGAWRRGGGQGQAQGQGGGARGAFGAGQSHVSVTTVHSRGPAPRRGPGRGRPCAASGTWRPGPVRGRWPGQGARKSCRHRLR